MSLFDVPEEDRLMVWLTGIICGSVVAIVLLACIRSNQELADAFSNGYEQVINPVNNNVLWKKSRKEQ